VMHGAKKEKKARLIDRRSATFLMDAGSEADLE
jgi:hypothetical protein